MFGCPHIFGHITYVVCTVSFILCVHASYSDRWWCVCRQVCVCVCVVSWHSQGLGHRVRSIFISACGEENLSLLFPSLPPSSSLRLLVESHLQLIPRQTKSYVNTLESGQACRASYMHISLSQSLSVNSNMPYC